MNSTRPVNTDLPEAEPTELDRRHAAESSPFADEHHVDERTPDDALVDTTDHDHDDEAEGPDMGAWWDWMEPDAELDARWSLTIAGGAGSYPDAGRRSMRVDPDEDARNCGLA